MNEKEFERQAEELRKARNEVMLKLLQKMPRNITLNDLKYAFIEHVVILNNYNRTMAAAELGINYTTIMGMIKRGEIIGKKPKKGRPKEE